MNEIKWNKVIQKVVIKKLTVLNPAILSEMRNNEGTAQAVILVFTAQSLFSLWFCLFYKFEMPLGN